MMELKNVAHVHQGIPFSLQQDATLPYNNMDEPGGSMWREISPAQKDNTTRSYNLKQLKSGEQHEGYHRLGVGWGDGGQRTLHFSC